MLALLLAWLHAFGVTPLHLTAGRLEVRGEHWWADGGVALLTEGLKLTAEAARGLRDPGCPGGHARLLGPVHVAGAGVEAQAAELELCLPDTAVAQNLSVVAPRLRLEADRATWQGGALTAEHLSATPCTCRPAPWHVTTRRAEITPGEGAWAEWPVLWVGPVPVATAPRWYMPLARRRTGFLFPIAGFDGEDGFHGRQPVFFTLGQSADLTLAPGYRQARGVTGHGTLRWAASDHEAGAVETRLIANEGAAFAGAGSLPLGPARLALQGSATTDESVRAALWPRLADRRLDHLRGTVSAGVAGRRTGLGFSFSRLEDLRRPLGAPDRVVTVAPDLWLRWHAAAGPAELVLSGRALTLLEEDDPKTLADVGIELEIPFWIGPLALRPIAGGATTLHLDDGQGQTGAVWAGGEARMSIARRFGMLRHEIAVIADGRWAEAAEPARGALLAIDLPLSSQSAGATLETRLSGAEVSATLALRQGYEAEAPVEGRELPLLILALESPDLRLDGGTAGDEATWGRLSAGESLRIHLGFTRLRPSLRTPTLRRLGPQRPLTISTLTGDLTTAEAGGGFTWGSLSLDVAAVADAEAHEVLGSEAGLRWTSGCDCWSARLRLSHAQGRDRPDGWLSLSVP